MCKTELLSTWKAEACVLIDLKQSQGQIVWQNYQESLRCLFIEIFVNHKLKVFMKSVMAGKRSIKEVLVSVACKVLLKIKAEYTWHAAVICQ